MRWKWARSCLTLLEQRTSAETILAISTHLSDYLTGLTTFAALTCVNMKHMTVIA